MLYPLLRSLLFCLPPELTHFLAGASLRTAATLPPVAALMQRRSFVSTPELACDLWGIRFPNPVGLAAGFDKDARFIPAMPLLGFGFTEVGTVTPRPQPGNPRPILFRVTEQRAILNRMGFNNRGTAAMAARLEDLHAGERIAVPVGVNLGKNRDTPLERAPFDYLAALERLHDLADYFVINVSSPNTPGLRDLQAPERLGALLEPLVAHTTERARATGRTPRPLLLKLSPDLDPGHIEPIVTAARRAGVAGFVATNTTADRTGLSARWQNEAGGLSGPPLREPSTRLIRNLYRLCRGEVPIIGVGGIAGFEDAWARIRAGASLLQFYTGLIYEGPCLAARINRGLIEKVHAAGFDHLSEAVGTDAVAPDG